MGVRSARGCSRRCPHTPVNVIKSTRSHSFGTTACVCASSSSSQSTLVGRMNEVDTVPRIRHSSLRPNDCCRKEREFSLRDLASRSCEPNSDVAGRLIVEPKSTPPSLSFQSTPPSLSFQSSSCSGGSRDRRMRWVSVAKAKRDRNKILLFGMG